MGAAVVVVTPATTAAASVGSAERSPRDAALSENAFMASKTFQTSPGRVLRSNLFRRRE